MGPAEPSSTVATTDSDIELIISNAGGVWDLDQASEHLGLPRNEVHALVKQRRLLGFMHRGRLVLPRSQFKPGGSHHVLIDGLDELLSLFSRRHYGSLGVLQWLASSHPGLETTPFKALRDGRSDEVRAYVETLLGFDQD